MAARGGGVGVDGRRGVGGRAGRASWGVASLRGWTWAGAGRYAWVLMSMSATRTMCSHMASR